MAAFVRLLVIHLTFLGFAFSLANGQGLQVGFYNESCPNLEPTVKRVIGEVISVAPSFAASFLRMQFHDCFVRGCDGSVLLDPPDQNQKAEKDAIPNQTLRGFQIIDKVKAAVEKTCPGVVSCADILALASRDAIVAIKGPFWEVETGRRDGRVSTMMEALSGLPPPKANISTLKHSFVRRGLTAKDLVVLSGGHTIGISHCSSFINRLYNFTTEGGADPALHPSYVARLKMKCKPGDENTIVEMDPGSFKTFDESYFRLVAQRRGLFESDAALLNDDETKSYLRTQRISSGSTFFKDFGESMVKLGRLQVLTGTDGEIREVCSKVNYQELL